MQRIDYGGQKATLDALPAADGSPGYYTAGSPPTTAPTRISAGHLNQIQEELCNFLEDYSVSLDRANDEQIKTLLATRIKAIYNSATDTGNTTTTHLRVILAVTTCKATGARTAVIASQGDGADSVVASGTNAIILASKGDTNGDTDPITNAGLQSIIAGAQDTTIDSNSARAAVIACNNAHMASGLSAAVVASGGCTSGGSQTLVGASSGCEMNANAEDSAIVGSLNGIVGTTSQGVLLASKNCELAEDLTVAGGYHATTAPTPGDTNQNLTWKIASATGNMVIDGTYSTAGADYAEYFQRLPGHPEIPKGHFAALMPNPDGSGLCVVLAGEGDVALGITSAFPGVIGNAAPMTGVETSELGAPIRGELAPQEPVDSDLIALLGQVRCYYVGELAPGDRLVPTFFGKGRKANPGEGGYLVLKITSPGVAQVLVR